MSVEQICTIIAALMLASCVRVHAQFGVEQPIFAQRNTAVSAPWNPTNEPTLNHWWVASDNTTGDYVTNWVARISGAQLVIDSTNRAPTATTNGVYFNGDTRYLTNNSSIIIGTDTVNTTNTVFLIIEMLPITNVYSNPFNCLWGASTGTGLSGRYFDWKWSLDGYNAGQIVFDPSLSRFIDIVFTTAYGSTSYAYTNGVLAGSSASLMLGTMKGLARDPGMSANHQFKGYIQEVGVLTGTNLNLSTFHTYATNTYGFSP